MYSRLIDSGSYDYLYTTSPHTVGNTVAGCGSDDAGWEHVTLKGLEWKPGHTHVLTPACRCMGEVLDGQ